MAFVHFIRKYWYVPVLALGALLAFIVLRRDPTAILQKEIEAIDAGERARLQAIEQGAEAANSYIDFQHKKTLEALDAEQSAKADRLRSDPKRRAKWLTRLAKEG